MRLYEQDALLYLHPTNSLRIVFEVMEWSSDFGAVNAVPGSAFIVDRNRLIPWKDYPLALDASNCVPVPYELRERYRRIGV